MEYCKINQASKLLLSWKISLVNISVILVTILLLFDSWSILNTKYQLINCFHKTCLHPLKVHFTYVYSTHVIFSMTSINVHRMQRLIKHTK